MVYSQMKRKYETIQMYTMDGKCDQRGILKENEKKRTHLKNETVGTSERHNEEVRLGKYNTHVPRLTEGSSEKLN